MKAPSLVTLSVLAAACLGVCLLPASTPWVGTYEVWYLSVEADNDGESISLVHDAFEGITVDIVENPDGTFSLIVPDDPDPDPVAYEEIGASLRYSFRGMGSDGDSFDIEWEQIDRLTDDVLAFRAVSGFAQNENIDQIYSGNATVVVVVREGAVVPAIPTGWNGTQGVRLLDLELEQSNDFGGQPNGEVEFTSFFGTGTLTPIAETDQVALATEDGEIDLLTITDGVLVGEDSSTDDFGNLIDEKTVLRRVPGGYLFAAVEVIWTGPLRGNVQELFVTSGFSYGLVDPDLDNVSTEIEDAYGTDANDGADFPVLTMELASKDPVAWEVNSAPGLNYQVLEFERWGDPSSLKNASSVVPGAAGTTELPLTTPGDRGLFLIEAWPQTTP